MTKNGPDSLEDFEDRVLYQLVDLTGNMPVMAGEGKDEIELSDRLALDLNVTTEFVHSPEFRGSSAHGAVLAAVSSLKDSGLIEGAIYLGGHFEVRPTRYGRSRVAEWKKAWEQRQQMKDRQIQQRILQDLNRQRVADPQTYHLASRVDVSQLCSDLDVRQTDYLANAQRLVDQGKIKLNDMEQLGLDEGYAAITEVGVAALERTSAAQSSQRDSAEAWNEVANLRRRLQIAERSMPSLITDEELRRRCSDLLVAKGDYDRAIREACVVLENRVRKAINADGSLVGTSLMEQAFGEKNGLLKLSTHGAEQVGGMQIYRGVMALFRNHAGHHIVDTYTQVDAYRFVVWIDLLLTMLVQASISISPNTTTNS